MKKFLAVALAGVMALSMVACGGSSSSSSSGTTETTAAAAAAAEDTSSDSGSASTSSETVKLNLSVPDAITSSIAVAAQEFADELNEKSEGRLQVTLYPDGSLYGGDATAAVTTMQSGGLDMLCLATSWYASFDDSFNMINVPYIFKDVDMEQAYINDPASQAMWDSVENMGVKFLAAWTRSFRMTTNNKNPITKPEDFSGMVLRTPSNQIYEVFFAEGCGANVTPMSFSEVYTALQTGTIDGQENPVDVPFSSAFYEVQKYISATNHIGEAWVVGMNPDKFNSLDEDLQELIVNTAQEMQQWKKDYDERTDQDDIDYMVEQGMEYNELDEEGFAAFQAVSESLYDEFKAIVNNDEFWDATMDFVENY